MAAAVDRLRAVELFGVLVVDLSTRARGLVAGGASVEQQFRVVAVASGVLRIRNL
jgi:hypothetical protein